MSNAFEQAADALSKVKGLVLSGNELKTELTKIVQASSETAKDLGRQSQARLKDFETSANSVLGAYQGAAHEIERTTKNASAQVEAASAQIRAAAITATRELAERSETAWSRIAAEAVISQQAYEKATVTMTVGQQRAADVIKSQLIRHADILEKTQSALDEARKEMSLVASDFKEVKKEMLVAREDIGKHRIQALQLLAAAVASLILSAGTLLYLALKVHVVMK